MMNKLSELAKHLVFKIIFVIIILSVIFTGIGNYLVGISGNYAAKVNGHVIERLQFEQVFQIERQRIQEELGDRFSLPDNNKIYMQQIRQQVLSQLINNILLAQYANKLGLRVSDDQIKSAIRKIPYFQTHDAFDNTKYLNMIRNMGYTPDHFAHSMREKLVIQQIVDAFGKSSFVLPSESHAAATLVLQQRDVRLAVINPNTLHSNQNVSDEELQAYYYQHQNSFIAPAQIKVRYIHIDAASMQKKVKVSSSDISSYYNRHKSSYTNPERKNYSIIQLKTETEAKQVLSELKKGSDFITLAQEKSTDIISRHLGGNLGWLEQENTIEELKQACLTKKGQISDVVQSSIGYFIVRLNDIEPKKIKPLIEVYDVIAKQVRHEKTLKAYDTLKQKVSEASAISNDESLIKVEEAAGVKASQTGFFNRDNAPTALNFAPVLQVIFSNSFIANKGGPKSNARIISDGNRIFVVCMIGYKAERVEPLDRIKDSVIRQVKHSKAIEKAKLQGAQLLFALKQGAGATAIKSSGLSFGIIQKIKFSLSYNPLIESVFALPTPLEGKPVYGMTQDLHDNVILIELDAVKPGILSNNEMKIFISKMEDSAVSLSLYSLLSSLRKEASITIGSSSEKYQLQEPSLLYVTNYKTKRLRTL